VWLYDTQQYFKQHGKNLEVTLQQVKSPNELQYINAPKKLKEQFLEDVNNYRKSDKRLSSAVRFEMEMLRITKQLSETAHSTDKPFVDYIRKIAGTRNLDISKYIPRFESIID
jgi:predicted DNA-binding ribbon-helix-helix protein